jgi:hypothetical protein
MSFEISIVDAMRYFPLMTCKNRSNCHKDQHDIIDMGNTV